MDLTRNIYMVRCFYKEVAMGVTVGGVGEVHCEVKFAAVLGRYEIALIQHLEFLAGMPEDRAAEAWTLQSRLPAGAREAELKGMVEALGLSKVEVQGIKEELWRKIHGISGRKLPSF